MFKLRLSKFSYSHSTLKYLPLTSDGTAGNNKASYFHRPRRLCSLLMYHSISMTLTTCSAPAADVSITCC